MVVGVSRSAATRTTRAILGRRPRRQLPALVLALVIALLGACPAGGETQAADRADAGNRAGAGNRVTADDEPSPGEPSPGEATVLSGAGFDSVDMVTTVGVDTFERTILYTYWGDGDDAPVALLEAFDAFFAELEAAGVSVTADAAEPGYRTWHASFEADSPEQLASLTDVALRSTSTQFEVTQGPDDEPATPALAVVDFAECSAVCDPLAWVSDELVVPEEYEAEHAYVTEDGNVFIAMYTSPELVEYQVARAFADVSFELALGVGGDLTWTAEFFVDAATDEVAGSTLSDALRWYEGWQQIDVARSDEGTTYTVTVQGDDVEEFLESYDEWSGEGPLTLLWKEDLPDLPDSGASDERYRLQGLLVLPSSLGKHLPPGNLEMSVVVPPGYSFTNDLRRPGVSAGTDGLEGYATVVFDIEVSGSPQEGSAVGGMLVLLLVAAAVLLVVFRKRIRTAIAGERRAAPAGRADASAARRLAEASVAPVTPAAPGVWSPAPSVPVPEEAVVAGDVSTPAPPHDVPEAAPVVAVPSVLDRLAGIRTAELPPPPAPWGPTPDPPASADPVGEPEVR